MFKRTGFLLLMATVLVVNAETVNIRGKVTNKAGNGIAKAIVKLVKQGTSDTTENDGAFSIVSTGVRGLPSVIPNLEKMSLDNGILELSLSENSPVKIEVFDVKGNLLAVKSLQNAAAGSYRLNMIEKSQAKQLLIFKTTIGQRMTSFRYLPMNKGKYSVSSSVQNLELINDKLAKVAAVIDTIKITATGYVAKSIPISTVDTSLTVILDSIGGGSTGSIGCGKALSDLKTGKYTITSAGLNRQYYIDIPADYDPNKPYRLIFGMHCMCGSMEGVVNEKYYQLKTMADSAKVPCIFVSGSVYSTNYSTVAQNCVVWSQNEKDHTYFDDMLKLFKEKLCVDTARVFSCGFSFGAMFSYSLSISHQHQLRAVACYAPANYNIYMQTNKHKPIAYMSTTGMDDGTCPWINQRNPNTEGAKFAAIGHAQDNGCNTSGNITTTTKGSRTHVLYEYQGCNEGYPVKVFTFDGVHQWDPVDNGSGNMTRSWVPRETWKFFMQF